MVIREANVAHIAIIHKLAYDIWPSAYGHILSPAQLTYMLEMMYSFESLQKQIEEQGHRFIILYDNLYNSIIPIGFASFSKKAHTEPIVYRLHKLYVLPRSQDTGCGKYLLNYIIEEIKKEGAAFLELNVNRDNPAQYFYHKMGFIITKEEDIDIGHGFFMNDYVMERKLDGVSV